MGNDSHSKVKTRNYKESKEDVSLLAGTDRGSINVCQIKIYLDSTFTFGNSYFNLLRSISSATLCVILIRNQAPKSLGICKWEYQISTVSF